MTNEEIREWLFLLGRTRDERIARVRELLRHADGDRMSDDDRSICRRVLHGDLNYLLGEIPNRTGVPFRFNTLHNRLERRRQRREAESAGYIH